MVFLAWSIPKSSIESQWTENAVTSGVSHGSPLLNIAELIKCHLVIDTGKKQRLTRSNFVCQWHMYLIQLIEAFMMQLN